MISKIPTAKMTKKEWLDERRNSLGGSEIGAILGLNRYQSRYSIWANKTGRLPDTESNEAMRVGNDLEEYVAQRFSEKSGLKVKKYNYIVRNSEYPHIHANIDRRIIGKRAGLECKTCSALNEKAFTDTELPASYLCQCITYMAVNEFPVYYLAALIMGRSFKIYQLSTDPYIETPEWCECNIYVDPDSFRAIRQTAEQFWEYVESDTEPPVDGSAATANALQDLYSDPVEDDVDLFAMSSQFADLDYIKEQLDSLSKMKTELENEIKAAMGNSISGHNSGYSCTWKPQTRKTFDVKRFAKDHSEIDLGPYYKESTTRVFKYRKES